MPLSNRLNKLSRGWGKNRNTKPLRNTLANRAASKLTKNQIMYLLSIDPPFTINVMKAIEHRAKNIQNEKFRMFMKNYLNKKYRR